MKSKRKVDRAFLDTFHTMLCIACKRRGCEGHHVKTKASGGPDEPWNIMPLDRKCHAECHQIGLVKFSKKYKSVENWLISHDWLCDEQRNKWVRK